MNRAEKSSIGNRGRGYRKEIEALNAYLTNFQEEFEWRMQHPDWEHNRERLPRLTITMNKLRVKIEELQSKRLRRRDRA